MHFSSELTHEKDSFYINGDWGLEYDFRAAPFTKIGAKRRTSANTIYPKLRGASILLCAAPPLNP